MTKSHSKALFIDVRNKVILVALLVAVLFAFGIHSRSTANVSLETTKSSESGFTSLSPTGLSGGARISPTMWLIAFGLKVIVVLPVVPRQAGISVTITGTIRMAAGMSVQTRLIIHVILEP